MSSELDGAMMTLGSGAAAFQQAIIPQVVMGADEATAHARPAKDSGSDDEGAGSASINLSRPLRLVCLGVAYLCAGLTGWSLYELASPWRRALPELSIFQPAQKPSDSQQLLQATQKLASQLQALQSRMDAMSAASSKEERQAPNVEDVNRRIDAAKSDTAAEIRQLSNRVEELQREMNARLAEIGAASRQAERAAAEAAAAAAPPRLATAAAAAAPPRLATAVRVEDGYRRSHKRRADAFDPTLHPHAPGAPRPLGSRGSYVP